jgi:uracil-DNA glycosylase family 4
MQLGFFNKKEIKSTSSKGGKPLTCVGCGLLPQTLNPKFGPTGQGKKKILLVGAANNKVEDDRRKHWQGSDGRFLRAKLQELDIDVDVDCWSINAVQCRCDENPTGFQLDCCRRALLTTIKELQPRLIICFGWHPLYSLIGLKYNSDIGEFRVWRGFQIPDFDLGCYICPVHSPAWVQDAKGKETALIWDLDLKEALNHRTKVLPKYPEPEIHYLDDLGPLLNIESGIVSIDYETTGIKPHAPGHRIVCASVALSPSFAYVFMIPQNRADLLPFLQLLENPNVEKMAHNMKYEHTWAMVRWKVETQGWLWDSMQAAHILDNRRGVAGLKFQTFVNFGEPDYSSEISPYLRSKEDKDSNAFNRVLKLCESKQGQRKLMKYCALDTIYQYRLALLQQDRIWAPF